MNLAEIKRMAASLQKAMFNRGRSYSIGMWKSHFKGNGLQFKEHQVYSYGDEVRFIDWKITARTNHPYIKTFEEERNLKIQIVIDASPSMFDGHYEKSKLQCALEIACLIIVLAGKTRDLVNVILIHEEVTELRELSGDIGLIKLIKTMQTIGLVNADGTCTRLKILKKIPSPDEVQKNVFKKSGKIKEIVILSDFENYFKDESFFKEFLNVHFHLFRLWSGFESGEQRSISIEATNVGKSKGSVHLFESQEEIPYRKEMKDIDIRKNHLELFIGKMN